MRRVLWIIIPTLILLVGASSWLRLKISPLCLSASHSTLHVGESAQLFVTRKTWLGHRPLAHPEKTHYATTFESMAVVEPDGDYLRGQNQSGCGTADGGVRGWSWIRRTDNASRHA